MSNIEFEETIGTNHTLDSNGSNSVSFGKQFEIKKLGNIIANKISITMDIVDKIYMYQKSPNTDMKKILKKKGTRNL